LSPGARCTIFGAPREPENSTKSLIVFGHVGILTALGLIGCRGREPAQGLQNDAILTARTLGLAYLQNGQLAPAESAFRRVIDMAPEQALGYANLGLVLLQQGRYQEAETEIRRAAARDSGSNDIGLMLASVYRLTGRDSAARRQIERVLLRSPDDVQGLYALAQLAAQSQDSADGPRRESYLRRIVARTPANIAAQLELVDLLLARGEADEAVEHLEMLQRRLPELPRETTRYFDRALAEARAGRPAAALEPARIFHHLMQTTAPYQASLQHLRGAEGALAGYPILTFNPSLAPPAADARTVAAAIRFSDVTGAAGLAGVPALPDSLSMALATGDYEGNGDDDVFIAGHLFLNTPGRAIETTDRAGLAAAARTRSIAAVFGDYDNDGRLDLFIATAADGGRGMLFHNEGDSTFRDVTSKTGLHDVPPATSAQFVDLDHDGDLDLFLTTTAGNRAYRNTLDGTFRDMTVAMGLAGGPSSDAAFGDFDGDGHTDLVVVSADGRLTLFHNLGQGHFQDGMIASALRQQRSAGAIAIGDYDNDGFLDLLVASRDGSDPVLYANDGAGSFTEDPRGQATLRELRSVSARGARFFDYDNDGFLDLLVVGDPRASTRREQGGVLLFRNDQGGRFTNVSAILPADRGPARRVAPVDYDHDGDLDLLIMGKDGRARLWLNDGGNANQYVQVQLVALRAGSGKNNDFGIGGTLELRAGPLYQTRVVTGRVTHFGLGQRLKADVLRVHWPNGVSQTLYYPGTEEDVLEQQILKGSCPFLYAWDGRRFRMVTDVMWRSALGMPLGIMGSAGRIAAASPHASREYMRVPGQALAPRDGRYVLQLTEELWETGYLDQLQLLVVDHPESVDTYVNERFVPPDPGPASLRLYQVAHPRPPIAATDEHGHDLLALLRARDDAYVAGFTPGRYQGLTAMHDLILDFGDLGRMDSVFLFLAGWIYPTDASINLALAQAPRSQLVGPYLQVRDREGRWRTVIADLGFPSGKDKTVITDLTGKFLSADHRVRIRTNMEIYWDQAFVAATVGPSPVTITTLVPTKADLHYRGFSRMYRKGGRYGPPWFAYDDVSREQRWDPIVGSFTRYGDVLPLLGTPDDQYAIMGPGDEITLEFDAGVAPPLPSGWTRDFLLYSDAWLKDADLNTADGGTVGPLPFHGMSRYPYGPNEAYPDDATHRRYLESFNSRRVDRGRP
jgi:tetratricopeptide (TPR) repeat protein